MIEFTESIKDADIFQYYKNKIEEYKIELIKLGNSPGFVQAITSKYEHGDLAGLWIKEHEKVLGIASFGDRTDAGKGILTLHFFNAEPGASALLFSEIEKFAKSQGYLRISHLTSIKDETNIQILGDENMNVEFYHLFKKIIS